MVECRAPPYADQRRALSDAGFALGAVRAGVWGRPERHRRIAAASVRTTADGLQMRITTGVSSVPSTVEQLSPSRVKITVEVPFTDLEPSMDKAYREIAKSVNIPGFRRGKVPPMVIDQRFGRGVVIQEAFNDSWQGFYTAAVTENHLNP